MSGPILAIFMFVASIHDRIMLVRLAGENTPALRQFKKLALHFRVFYLGRRLFRPVGLRSIVIATCHPTRMAGAAPACKPRSLLSSLDGCGRCEVARGVPEGLQPTARVDRVVR